MQPQLQPEVAAHITAFKLWLERQGCQLLPTAQWELVRWRPPTGAGPLMVYTNKKGVIGKFSESEAREVWYDWLITFEDEARSQAPKAPVFTLPTRPHPEHVKLSSVGPVTVGDYYRVTRYTSGSYVGADIDDAAGRWVANIHGTNGRKAKPIPTYERNIWIFCNAEKMVQLLGQLANLENALVIDPQVVRNLGREVQEFLKGAP